jgi:hypothetical protein
MHTKYRWGNILGNIHFKDQEGDGKIRLRWIFGRWNMAVESG